MWAPTSCAASGWRSRTARRTSPASSSGTASWWGSGSSTSSTARALLTAAFDSLGLRRVTASANLDNLASVRVLEKAGMRRERHGVRSLWHHELGWLDEAGYALLAEEWSGA